MKAKKMLIALLAFCAVLLSACREKSAPATEVKTVSEAESSAFIQALPFAGAPRFTLRGDGSVKISMTMRGSDVSSFGNKIYEALNAAEAVFEEYTLDMVFSTGDEIMFLFSGDMDFATLTDKRSGEAKTTMLYSADDLAEAFPALRSTLTAEGNGVTDEEMAMYNEVDKALSDFSREEDEILEEIAPNYGMSAAELKEWMFSMMEKIY